MSGNITKRLLQEQQLSGVAFDGKWTAPIAPAGVIEPATGKKLGRIGMAEPAEIASAAAKARAAQPAWAATSYERRAEILGREQEQSEIDGMEGSRSAGAKMASVRSGNLKKRVLRVCFQFRCPDCLTSCK
ncbi:aldehyde dehydrogenase family protein [Agrobacterium sp. 22-226-1]